MISCVFYLNGQEQLSLIKAIKYGIENNHEIAIVINDSKLFKNNSHIGTAGILPNITISSGYNASINNSNFAFNSFLDFGDGIGSNIEANKAQSSNINSAINLNYTLFNGFSGIYSLKKISKQHKLADLNAKYQIENKIIDIIIKYYDLLNKENIYNVLYDTYNISLDRYNRVLEIYNYGSTSKIELLNAEVDLNTDLINLKNSQIDLNESRLNLALEIGVKDTTFILDSEFIFNQSLSLDSLKIKSKKNNSNLLIAQLNYQIAKQDLKISKSQFAPKINLFSSYSFTNMKSETSFISEQKDFGLIGGINIELPLFTSNIKRKNYQNAKINLDSKNHQLQQIYEIIESSISSTYTKYKRGLEIMDLQQENLNTYNLNFEKSKQLYLSGQIDNIQFRESQVNLSRFQINYSAILYSTKIQEYLLYQLSGMLEY